MPEANTRVIPNQIQGRAMVQPSTLNEDDRTVEVVFGTDTPVRMYNWDIGEFMEIMSFDEGHVRWSRFDNGAPVLDNHQRYNGARGVLGKVENYRTENGKGIATLRFSKRDDVEPIYQDVRDGILSGISFGYRVYKYEQVTSAEGELPKMRAIDWEPMEISLAPIQADSNAFIRSGEENSSTNVAQVEIIPLTLQSARSEEPEPQNEPEQTTRTMPTEGQPEANPTGATPAELESARKAAIAAEKTRSTEITALCAKHKMTDEFRNEAIEKDFTVTQVRELILTKIEENQPVIDGNRASVSVDEKDKVRAAMQESIEMRTNPKTQDKHGGSDFRGMSLVRLAEDSLQRDGISTKGMTNRQIAETALYGERSGMHTTSDFPIILGSTVNKSLMDAYALAPRTFTDWARRSSISDFKTKTVTKLSGLIDSFQEVPEGAEYEATTMSEDKEAYALTKYGRLIAITWETIVNDDLSAFSRIPQAIANKAAQKQSDIVYAILTGNPVMNDGTALFHANHKNLGTAGAISSTTLKELRKLLRNQTGIEGDFLNLDIATLIVGPENEEDALKYMNSAFSPSTVDAQNIYKGLANVVVEPRITNKNWFAAANPNLVDTIEYAFLDGEGELFTEQKVGFEVDGLQIKARMVFGAKAIDHRGLFKNPYA